VFWTNNYEKETGKEGFGRIIASSYLLDGRVPGGVML